MIYRPHFPYLTPPGCQDEPFEYYFDLMLPTGSSFSMVLGPLDKDAEYRWRGIRINTGAADGQEVAVQFRAPLGEYLSDDLINVLIYGQGPFDGGGGQGVAFDEEIVCPPGSVIESNWSVQA